MDGLFDDIKPAASGAQSSAKPAPPRGMFDDIQPLKEAETPGILSVAGQAGMRGLIEGGTQVAQATNPFKDRPQEQHGDYVGQLLQKPISEGWSDPKWWVANIAHGTAETAPSLVAGGIGAVGGTAAAGPVGGVVGGAGGFALGSMVQTIAPAYQRARTEGLDHDAAVDRALTDTGIAGAFGAVMGLAPELAVTGTAMKEGAKVLKRPISEALAQIFGVQPAIGAAQQEVEGISHGKAPTAEELATGYAGNVGSGLALTAGHRAYNRLRGAPVPPATPGTETESPPPPGTAPPGTSTAPAPPGDLTSQLTARALAAAATESRDQAPPAKLPLGIDLLTAIKSATDLERQAHGEGISPEQKESLLAQAKQIRDQFGTPAGKTEGAEAPPATEPDQAPPSPSTPPVPAEPDPSGPSPALPAVPSEPAPAPPTEPAAPSRAAPGHPMPAVPDAAGPSPAGPTAPSPAGEPPRAPDVNAPLPNRPIASAEAVTSTGRVVPVDYALVEAGDLVTSHTDDMRLNPQYPQGVQPRDRTRAASEMQIQSMINPERFRPDLLGPSPDAANGAPIVGPDGVVESGNMRSMAMRRAYDQGLPAAEAYRSWLESQGYNTDGMKAPLLVRINRGNMTPADREAFAREANKPAQLAMSASEQAMADAKALPASMLSLHRTGDIGLAGNRDFVKAFLRDIVGPNESARMIGADGSLSVEGRRRIESALLARAFDDAGIVSALTEDPDNGIKAIGGALTDVAPAWAVMRGEVESGAINPDVDISKHVVAAANIVRQARAEGRNVAEYVNQRDMFGGGIPPETEAVLRIMFRGKDFTKPRGRDKVADALRDYVTQARETKPTPGLFGKQDVVGPQDILSRVNAKQTAESEPTADLFGRAPDSGQRPAQLGEDGQGPERGPGGPEAGAASLKEEAGAFVDHEGGEPEKPNDRLGALTRYARETGAPATPAGTFRAITDWVRGLGKSTGNEYLGASTPDGTIIAGVTNHQKALVGLTPKLRDMMLDPSERVTIHHNHPSSSPLGTQDLSMLRAPGLEWVIAHGHGGEISAARLTPEVKTGLSWNEIHGVFAAVYNETFKHLLEKVKAGTLQTADANKVILEGLNRGLARGGMIEYVSSHDNSKYPPEHLADTIAFVEARTRNILFSLGVSAPGGDAAVAHRSAFPLRAPDAVARILGPDAQSRSVGPSGPTGDRPIAERPESAAQGEPARGPPSDLLKPTAPQARPDYSGPTMPLVGRQGTLFDERHGVTETPEFKHWFGESKAVDENGAPRVYYHGTSKDAPFHAFKAGRHGVWFTADPHEASTYAEDNDSQGHRYDGRDFVRTNTASRVMPTYLRLENPYTGEYPPELARAANYKAAQSSWFDTLRRQGYDGWMPNNGVAVAFDAKQIKSAIGNRGTFDPNHPSILRDEPDPFEHAPPFFSALTKGVSDLNLAKAHPSQWLGTLDGLRNKGVKEEELAWSGVRDWLKDQKGLVTKDQVLDHLRQNEVQIKEVTHGTVRDETGPDEQAGREHGPEWDRLTESINRVRQEIDARHHRPGIVADRGFANTSTRDLENMYPTLESQRDALHERMVDETMARQGLSGKPTKFGKYTLPGGENYREMLLTMPEPPKSARFRDLELKVNRGDRMSVDEREEYYRLAQEGLARETFTAGHFDEPNVLAHVRMNDRTVPTYTPEQIADIGERIAEALGTKPEHLGSGAPLGAVRRGVITPLEAAQFSHAKGYVGNDKTGAVSKILHVEEIQSDWHQKGRKEGYAASPEEIAAADERLALSLPGVHGALHRNDQLGFDTNEQARRAVRQHPDWADRWDVDHADRPAIAEYYDAYHNLSKVKAASKVPDAPLKNTWHEMALKRVIRHAAENGYDKVTWTRGETQAARYDLSKKIQRLIYSDGELTAFDHNGKQIMQEDVAEKDLPDHIGKEATDKLLAAPDEGTRIENGQRVPWREISGLDLKTEHKGMKGFYDKMLPAAANKIAKPFGAKVGEGEVQTAQGYGKTWSVYNSRGDHVRNFDSMQEAYRYQEDPRNGLRNGRVRENNEVAPKTEPVHSLDITDPMRESAVGKGFALFDERDPFGPAHEESRRIQRTSSRVSEALRKAADGALDLTREFQMKATPMARGNDSSRASTKDYANSIRESKWDTALQLDFLKKNFSADQLKKMWDAADEQSVAMQTGQSTDGIGLARLSREERDFVQALQARADYWFNQAREAGMHDSPGLPSYAPRKIVNIVEGQIKRVGSEGGTKRLDEVGGNLRTSTGHLKHRENLTTEQTEAAAQEKFGEGATVVRDIRTLASATGELQRAVAGRRLLNTIKEYGHETGTETVVEGAQPAGDPHWFTIENHPSFWITRPKMRDRAEPGPMGGTREAVVDDQGNTVFERVPLFVRDDFEGPLRAVLSRDSGKIYNGLMDLKSKTMGVIMYSPLIHNAVEWGRALPAMPGKVASFKIYFEGNAAKHNTETMRQAIQAGLVPIGHRYGGQDITSILEEGNIAPGRSWTAKLLAAVPGLFDPRAGDAVKRAVDRMGDFWHNTLLWDRVGDLQMGLYTNLRDQKIRAGVDPQTAQRYAAHFANRYAGALPLEAMSTSARKIANLVLFSRTFTLGNLGAMKDMVVGLPRDVQSQILRDRGTTALQNIQSASKRKAIATIAMDVALMYVGNSMLQSGIAILAGDSSLDNEAQGYARRLNELMMRGKENPLELLNPLRDITTLTPGGENEPGKEDRVLVGYAPAPDSYAVYMRNPTGKIGEEMIGWLNPLDQLKRKLGTIAKPAFQLASNDQGFGRKVYDEAAKTPQQYIANLGRIMGLFLGDQIPLQSLQAVRDLYAGRGNATVEQAQILGPFFGLTFSKGAPGGPAVGELYHDQEQHRFAVQQALPDIRKMIQDGDVQGAQQKMTQLGIKPALQQFYIRTTQNPASRLSGRALKDFELYGTPEQKRAMERFQQQP